MIAIAIENPTSVFKFNGRLLIPVIFIAQGKAIARQTC